MPDHHLGEKTLSTLARLVNATLPSLLPRGVMRWRCSISRGAIAGCIFDYRQRNARASLEGELLHRDDLPADVAELVCISNGIPEPACISSMTTVGFRERDPCVVAGICL